jgi:hypothetical protein
MKRTIALVATVAIYAVCSTALAIYGVIDQGVWPKSWPKQLEPLRQQARTLDGPVAPYRHFAIPFAKQDQFESAWPHILKVKTKGAPVVLVRGPNFFLGKDSRAGVVVHSRSDGRAEKPDTGERPIKVEGPIEGVQDARMRWMNTTYIELVVDGQIVDLNRIPLPADTPIIDERFSKGQESDGEARR